jgi:hypothetical protein
MRRQVSTPRHFDRSNAASPLSSRRGRSRGICHRIESIPHPSFNQGTESSYLRAYKALFAFLILIFDFPSVQPLNRLTVKPSNRFSLLPFPFSLIISPAQLFPCSNPQVGRDPDVLFKQIINNHSSLIIYIVCL